MSKPTKLNEVLTVPQGLPSAGMTVRVGGTTERPLYDAVDVDSLYCPWGNRAVRAWHSQLPYTAKGWIGKRHALPFDECLYFLDSKSGLSTWLSSEDSRLRAGKPQTAPAVSSPAGFDWDLLHCQVVWTEFPGCFSVLSGAYTEIKLATAARAKFHPERKDRLDAFLGKMWAAQGNKPLEEKAPIWLPEKGTLCKTNLYPMSSYESFRRWLYNTLYEFYDWAGESWQEVSRAMGVLKTAPLEENPLGKIKAVILGFAETTGAKPSDVWSACYKAYEAVYGLPYDRQRSSKQEQQQLLFVTRKVLGEWLPDFAKHLGVQRSSKEKSHV